MCKKPAPNLAEASLALVPNYLFACSLKREALIFLSVPAGICIGSVLNLHIVWMNYSSVQGNFALSAILKSLMLSLINSSYVMLIKVAP